MKGQGENIQNKKKTEKKVEKQFVQLLEPITCSDFCTKVICGQLLSVCVCVCVCASGSKGRGSA